MKAMFPEYIAMSKTTKKKLKRKNKKEAYLYMASESSNVLSINTVITIVIDTALIEKE